MQAAMELDTELPTAALIRGQMRAAIADGWGDRDWAALGEWIDQRAAARALAGARDE
jgi:3-hydroxyisobutyrate dehydrogenase-like beta-hydroxyacid dehydrogenase